MLVQRQRDQAAGLNTVGFVSGYRDSPTGAFAQRLEQVRGFGHVKQESIRATEIRRTALLAKLNRR